MPPDTAVYGGAFDSAAATTAMCGGGLGGAAPRAMSVCRIKNKFAMSREALVWCLSGSGSGSVFVCLCKLSV